jgi:hypothetical protein
MGTNAKYLFSPNAIKEVEDTGKYNHSAVVCFDFLHIGNAFQPEHLLKLHDFGVGSRSCWTVW